jgi:formate hydrogenlyase subunit 4
MSRPLAVAVHIAVLLLAPLPMLGIISVVKARFAGRQGPPILQPLWDVWKLLGKGAVYSRTTSWVFVAGPILSLATALCAGLLVPLGAGAAPLAFGGDVFLFAYLLGLGRFFTMAAALDTGSAFEGMGASREAAFSALAEPALFLALMTFTLPAAGKLMAPSLSVAAGPSAYPVLLAAALALGVVLLTEAARVPVDDPNTHLELTMIHEVMVLDHSGPDLAFILYGYAIKLFALGAVLIDLIIPGAAGWRGLLLLLGGEALLAVVIGVIESTMARLRLSRVPQLIVGATVIAALGLLILYRGARP